MIKLRLRVGDDPVVRDFADESVMIGRSMTNHVVIRDRRVSRTHARIETGGTGVQLIDLQSGNGTRLNGRKIDSGPLRAGDMLEIGPTRLMVMHAEAGELSTKTVESPVMGPSQRDSRRRRPCLKQRLS